MDNKKDAVNFRLAQALYSELGSIHSDIDQFRRQISEACAARQRLLKSASDGDWECIQEELGLSDELIEEAYEQSTSRDEWDELWLDYCHG